MNDILTDTAKSFRLMRPKTQSGTFKPMSTYTKKRDILNLSFYIYN